MDMSISDANMYFSGSYLEGKDGNLYYLRTIDDDGDAYLYKYTSPSNYTNVNTHYSELEGMVNLKAFPLKPYCYEGSIISPTFRSVRCYKDGVNSDRVEFKVVKGIDYFDRHDSLRHMFFEKVYTAKEGIERIVKGEDYASIEDDFLLVPVYEEIVYPDEPFYSGIIGKKEETGDVKITSGTSSFTIGENSRTAEISADLPDYVKDKLLRIYIHCERHFGREPKENTVYSKMQNAWLRWFAKCNELSSEERELEGVDLYRNGLHICNILEKPTGAFEGLPRLTKFVKELRDEYNNQTSGL